MNRNLGLLFEKILYDFSFDNKIYNKKINEHFNQITLKHFLYLHYYAHQPILYIKHNNEMFSLLMYDDLNFKKRIRRANKGSGYFISDWMVVSHNKSRYRIRKSGIELVVDKDKHLANKSPQVGSLVSCRFPKERLFASRGFYVAVSNHGPPTFKDQIVKIYFNINSTNSVQVMKILTTHLSNVIPFTYKTLSSPKHYKRRDSAVLYFNKDNFNKIFRILNPLIKKYQHLFTKGVPSFTKPLYPGIGLAEEPLQINRKESFGENRCRLLSNGIVEIFNKNIVDEKSKFQTLLNKFVDGDVNIVYPYLNCGSENIYMNYKKLK